MSRPALIVGALLIAFGLAVFGIKVFAYQIPLAVAEGVGPWQVEARVNVRGSGARGSVRALLPATEPGQTIIDEKPTTDRLEFDVRPSDGANRIGVWSGAIGPIHEVAYSFHVQMSAVDVPLPADGRFDKPPAALAAQYLVRAPALPIEAPEIAAQLAALDLPSPSDLSGRVRTIYQAVTHEVATVNPSTDDALLALANREGTEAAKEMLLVTLLRAAGVPARLVHGLELRQDAKPRERTWSEAWVNGVWVPMSTGPEGFFADGFRTRSAGNAGNGLSVHGVPLRYNDLEYTERRDQHARRPGKRIEQREPGHRF